MRRRAWTWTRTAYAVTGVIGIILISACSGGGSGTKTSPPPTRTPARGTATAQGATATPALTALASATVPGGGTPTADASAPSGPACTAGAVSAHVDEQGGAGSIAGSVEIKNESAAACLLRPLAGQIVPTLRIKDASGNVLPTDEQPQPGAIPDAAVMLNPGQSAFVTYVWSNWCGAAPSSALSVAYALPGGGEIAAPIAGVPSQDAVPRCDDTSRASTLIVGNLFARSG